MSKMKPIPKGATFTITAGEYSDYGVHGVFIALEDIDTSALQAEYFSLHPEQEKTYGFREDQFLAWVCAKPLMRQLDSWEWHLGGNGCFARGGLFGPDGDGA